MEQSYALLDGVLGEVTDAAEGARPA
jgi:hypothetical protein